MRGKGGEEKEGGEGRRRRERVRERGEWGSERGGLEAERGVAEQEGGCGHAFLAGRL